MSTLTPLRPVEQAAPEPEALIEEARARQRRRQARLGWTAVAAVCLTALAGVAAISTTRRTTSGDGPFTAAAGTRCPAAALGEVAFLRGGRLELLDLSTCRTKVLVASHAGEPVSFSPDGRFVAFGGGYVSTAGGAVHRVDGTPWWSPQGLRILTTVGANGLGVRTPGGPTRVLLPSGWGVHTTALSADGRTLAVSRSTYRIYTQPPPYHQEIWLVDVGTGSRRMIFAEPPKTLAPAMLQGFSPDGRWLLFFEDLDNGASLAADGLPLEAVNVKTGAVRSIGRGTLLNPTFTQWCGGSLLYVLNRGGRMVTLGDGLASASPPRWDARTILPAGGKVSWNGVACRPGGKDVAVEAGPVGEDSPFGQEHRSIWLAPLDGAPPVRLTRPPGKLTDELPQWSADGRWLLFVRTTPGGVDAAKGALYALDVRSHRLVGPIARVGTTGDYYGSYGWPGRLAWYRR
jgi:Tol biopolymer transport system component